ncbi:unnamed protein product [Cunninghamella blakesleeana]
MRLSTIVLSLGLLVSSLNAQGVSRSGEKDGKALYAKAVKLPMGDYEFTTGKDDSFLSMIQPNNNLIPKKKSYQWELRQHKKTKLFSLHAKNEAGNEKCVSTRWNFGDKSTNGEGYPDAAVMWQCEINGSIPKDQGPYPDIYPPKQLWLAVPDTKVRGQYKIVSFSHLYDMIPRCISNKPIEGGTTLSECKIDTVDDDLLWNINKV